MAEITLQSISHSYAAAPGEGDYALRDIELRWRDGGAYALLGPSGCGKTTLLNIMSGLIRPTSGRVRYGDKDVTDLDTRRRNIAQVFQFPVIYDTFTVFENLAFPLRNRGLKGSEVTSRVHHIAELLELEGVLRERATELSADQKQIVSLGRGLIRDDVAAILFDEPLTVIDPHRKWTLRRRLREIHRKFKHTLIYVTHDQTEALTFADEVVVMHEGRVLQQATPEELFANPAHTYVGYFIGSPGMNVLPCSVDGNSAVIAGQLVPLPEDLAGRAAGRTGALELGIRPEHVVVGPAAGGVPATIDHVEDHGGFRIVTAAIGEHRIKIKLGAGAPVAAGETCRLGLPPERIRLYEGGRSLSGAAAAAIGGRRVSKRKTNLAWLLVLPMVVVVAFSAIVPLMTVVNYSVQDILGPNTRVFVGFEWFRKVLRDPELHGAFLRQLLFSSAILAVQLPLGVGISLLMPKQGWRSSATLVVLALPLLIPWNVVGTMWQIFCRSDIGMAGAALHGLGINYNYTANPVDAWLTVVVMDVWHWTPLVALLSFSGLRAIPDAYYLAARIDGASTWAVFRYIQLPKLKNVLVIAVLLRFMDSFMIYTEPFVLTGGGPGNSTTFLSQFLTRLAVGQFDLGPAAAFSLIYFLFILFFCYVFRVVMMRPDEGP